MSEKGYIFKDDGIWKVATVASLGANGEALCQVQGEYETWGEALHLLIAMQLGAV